MPTSQVLTLREYESAQLGDEWDVARKVLPEHAASALEKMPSNVSGEVFSVHRRKVTARNFVGTVGLGQRAIEILPKTDGETAESRRRLLEMLSVAGLVPFREADIAAQQNNATLLDAYMKLYLARLSSEWRRGRIMDYRKTDRNRTFLKGKLLFHEQLRQNLCHAERFYTRCDEFISDVQPARLLKAAVDVCRRFAVLHSVRRDASSLLMEFDDVADVQFQREEVERLSVDRRLARFEPILELAKRLVRLQTPDRYGTAQTFSLLFDMNVVFERYIAALMQRLVCPPEYTANAQIGGQYLLHRDSTRKFGLRPDLAVYRAGDLQCLLDTKWKRLDTNLPHEGVSQADMYQMYAYAKEFRCPLVILLFPRHSNLPSRVASYRLPPATAESARIEVCTVDVTQPPRQVAVQLQALLRHLLG